MIVTKEGLEEFWGDICLIFLNKHWARGGFKIVQMRMDSKKIQCDISNQIWNVCIIWSDYVVEGYRHVCFVGLGSVRRLADSYWLYGTKIGKIVEDIAHLGRSIVSCTGRNK